MVNPSVL